MEKYYFLKKDLDLISKKIDETKIKLREAQETKNIATTQSSETWHDNYGFEEGLREVRRYAQEIDKLTEIYNKAIIAPKPKNGVISIGNFVTFKDEKEKEISVKIGSFLILEKDESISYASPLGELLMGSRIGQTKESLINGKLKKFSILKIE